MASRLNLARVGALVLGASAALMLAALPASADTGTATATVDSHHDLDFGSVKLKSGNETTALMALKVADGSEILTYCVDISAPEGGNGTTMTQVPWTDYPDAKSPFNKNEGKINWILHNSFPTLDTAALSKAAGITTTLSDVKAVEGTQAAIWHFSDGTDLANNGNNADVVKLYNYLVGTAVDLPQPPADAHLALTSPSSTSGKSGDKIGPFVVDTNLQLLALTSQVPSGVKVEAVDAQGNAVALDKIVNGTKIYFDVDSDTAAGNGTFTITGGLQIGQLFVGQDVVDASHKPGGVKQNCKTPLHQSLIVAESKTQSVTGAGSWVVPTPPTTTTTTTTTTTAPPSTTTAVVAPTTDTTAPSVVNTASPKPLAYTGVSIFLPVLIAVVLILAGAGFLIVQRRRKRV
jgi:TQXA domain-containing protein